MRWLEIALPAPPSRIDLVGEMLLRYVPQGFWDAPGGRSRRVLRAYVPATNAGRGILTRLRRAVAISSPATRVHARMVRGMSSMRGWQVRPRTIRVGRLHIRPPVRSGRRRLRGRTVDDAVTIRLDAGMAFGSGDHPTTQLCLRAIDRYVHRRATVVDIGTGSGILAIAAARLGARRVVAVDNDPIAVEVARANVRSNRVTARVTVRHRNGLTGMRGAADVIVANLTAETLPPIVAGVPRLLRPGGRFIVSGFGTARSGEVEAAFLWAGLTVASVERLRGWCAVHGTRARPPRTPSPTPGARNAPAR